MFTSSARQVLTVHTTRAEVSTPQRQVAEGCGGPHVVHGPHHGLTATQYLPDDVQRQKALIDPMQVNDVGLLELRQPCDVGASIGQVYLEQVFAPEMQLTEHHETFPKKIPSFRQFTFEPHNADVLSLFVAHQHFGFNTIIIKRSHQTVGSNSRSPRLFARVYNQYFHKQRQRYLLFRNIQP